MYTPGPVPENSDASPKGFPLRSGDGFLERNVERAADAVDEAAILQGLLQNLPVAGAGGPLAKVPGRLGGDQDGRKIHAPSPQPVHELDPVHGGHVIVDHQTAVCGKVPVGEEILAALVQAHVQPLELEDEL